MWRMWLCQDHPQIPIVLLQARIESVQVTRMIDRGVTYEELRSWLVKTTFDPRQHHANSRTLLPTRPPTKVVLEGQRILLQCILHVP